MIEHVTLSANVVAAVSSNLEMCDDGNTRSNDGCDSECHVEKGWVCVPSKIKGEEMKSNCTIIAAETSATTESSTLYFNVVRAMAGLSLLICLVVIYYR